MKPHIFSFDTETLKATLKDGGIPAFRAGQILQWVYEKGVLDPENMTNIGKKDAEKLRSMINFDELTVVQEQLARDGTVKWLFKLHDGHDIEAVFIPESTRGTLCVSSQVGCTLNCRFCHTGTQGLSRNLMASEIVAQMWMANKRLGTWTDEPFDLHTHLTRNDMTDSYLMPKKKRDTTNAEQRRVISNMVFMGMGEPLFNWENVKKANDRLMAEDGFGLGTRRITISTSGMVPNIGEIGKDLGVNLAVSIHAPDNETRTRIMPVNKKWPIEELMAAIRAFPLKEKRRITWEYVMLKDVNDSEQHAKELVKLIKGIPSFINIIPFNEWPGSPFKCSEKAQIEKFKNVIAKAGVDTQIRRSRGDDILAACGQLRGETSKFNSISTEFPTVVMQYGNERQKESLKVNIEHS